MYAKSILANKVVVLFICHTTTMLSSVLVYIQIHNSILQSNNIFCVLQHLAESLLHVILNKLKAQKNATNYNFSQALCRVYAGICRQLGDLERARLFCYSLLKEGTVWLSGLIS